MLIELLQLVPNPAILHHELCMIQICNYNPLKRMKFICVVGCGVFVNPHTIPNALFSGRGIILSKIDCHVTQFFSRIQTQFVRTQVDDMLLHFLSYPSISSQQVEYKNIPQMHEIIEGCDSMGEGHYKQH